MDAQCFHILDSMTNVAINVRVQTSFWDRFPSLCTQADLLSPSVQVLLLLLSSALSSPSPKFLRKKVHPTFKTHFDHVIWQIFQDEKGQFDIHINWHDVQIQIYDDFRRKLHMSMQSWHTVWVVLWWEKVLSCHKLYLHLESAIGSSSFTNLPMIFPQNGTRALLWFYSHKDVSPKYLAALKGGAKMIKVQGSPTDHHHQQCPPERSLHQVR